MSSLPNLNANPNILFLSFLLSAPIVIALEFIFFADDAAVSPTFPTLTVPSLQYDQLPNCGSAVDVLLLVKEDGVIKFDNDAKISFENWNLIFWLVKLLLSLFLLSHLHFSDNLKLIDDYLKDCN